MQITGTSRWLAATYSKASEPTAMMTRTPGRFANSEGGRRVDVAAEVDEVNLLRGSGESAPNGLNYDAMRLDLGCAVFSR